MLHFGFRAPGGHRLQWPPGPRPECPFSETDLDCGEYLPNGVAMGERRLSSEEPQSACKLTHARGWTVLGCWDRTGDSRPSSNSSFLCEGSHDFLEMASRAVAYWPDVLARIEAVVPLRLWEPT